MSVTMKEQEATPAGAERAKEKAAAQRSTQGCWERAAAAAWQPPASHGWFYHLKYGQKQNFINFKTN